VSANYAYRVASGGSRVLGWALVTLMIFLGGSEAADAATLKASYQLQGNRASEISGTPDLVDLGSGNQFTIETVEGITRQVLTFPQGGGLSLNTAGLVDPSNHSVVMTFRLADVSGYRRILDFSGGASDNGLYNLDGRAVLYVDGIRVASQGAMFDGSYVRLVFMSAAAPNGEHETAVWTDRGGLGTTSHGFGLGSGTLRFFKDNVSGGAGGEESAGAVACVLLFDGTLDGQELGQVLNGPPPCSAPPAPPPPPPPPAGAQPKASATGKPHVRTSGGTTVVDTGLTVSCPRGFVWCAAHARVRIASISPRPWLRKGKRLGSVRFRVPPGSSKRVLVQLSRRAAGVVRDARVLKVSTRAKITMAGGGRSTAWLTGRIKAPRRP
jgi:hypothetical protein